MKLPEGGLPRMSDAHPMVPIRAGLAPCYILFNDSKIPFYSTSNVYTCIKTK